MEKEFNELLELVATKRDGMFHYVSSMRKLTQLEEAALLKVKEFLEQKYTTLSLYYVL